MKIGLFKKSLCLLFLVAISVATKFNIKDIESPYVGRISLSRKSNCESLLNQNEAIISPNKKYMVTLNNEGKLLLLEKDNNDYYILWESSHKQTWFGEAPYSLVAGADNLDTIYIIDKNGLVTWYSSSDNFNNIKNNKYTRYEAILTNDGKFYIKEVNEDKIDSDEKHDVYYHIFSDGDTSSSYELTTPYDSYCYTKKSKTITKLDSFENPFIFPTDNIKLHGFYIEENNTKVEFGISRYFFDFNYETPRCTSRYTIFQTPSIDYSFEKESKIAMGKLGNDGVFRIYNSKGKVLSSIGEPCSTLGHCTLKIESTDIYSNGNVASYYDCPDIPLSKSVVITNALGEKFYYPPPLVTPTTNTTTTTPTTTVIATNATSKINIKDIEKPYVGKFSFSSKDKCETILSQNEAIVSPNKKYMITLNNEGKLLLLERDNDDLYVLWESIHKRTWFGEAPYSLVSAADNLDTIYIIDKYGLVIWYSSSDNFNNIKNNKFTKYEAILDNDGQFYIKEVNEDKNDNEKKYDVYYHIFSDGDASGSYEVTVPYTSPCYTKGKKNISKLDSVENPYIFPTDDFKLNGFTLKENNTKLEFGISRYFFKLNYETPLCGRGNTIYQTPFNNSVYEEENKIVMGKLGNDGVFNIYNSKGKVLKSIGEPSSTLGHCILKFEPTDIYDNGNISSIYQCPDVPLRNSLVITNALGEKFYYPPPISYNPTTTTTTTTTSEPTTTTTTITKTKTTISTLKPSPTVEI